LAEVGEVMRGGRAGFGSSPSPGADTLD